MACPALPHILPGGRVPLGQKEGSGAPWCVDAPKTPTTALPGSGYRVSPTRLRLISQFRPFRPPSSIPRARLTRNISTGGGVPLHQEAESEAPWCVGTPSTLPPSTRLRLTCLCPPHFYPTRLRLKTRAIRVLPSAEKVSAPLSEFPCFRFIGQREAYLCSGQVPGTRLLPEFGQGESSTPA